MNDQPPVSVGEEHTVEINAVGEKGDGIARVRGFVIFVPNVKKGDYVKIKITKVLPKVGFAQVVQHLEKQVREPKFATVTEKDLQEEAPHGDYEDTEDFGEDQEEE